MQAFDNSDYEAHKVEAKEKWGQTPAYTEYETRTKGYSESKWDDLACGMDRIMAEFARCMKNGEMPDSPKAQALVNKLQTYISEHYYHCTNEILASLGQMYVADERFRNNIDQHAAGTAEFICKAITFHSGK